MPEVFHRSIFLEGPAGRLEATLWTASAASSGFVAVICHPHPLYGGTMHNKVVFQAAKTLHQCGASVLRFNFRGVEQSEGAHDHGIGEQADVRAALDYLSAEFPGKPILLGGFSFGSWVGLRVGCEDTRVTRLISLGLPADNFNLDFSYLRSCAKPKLFIQGGEDQFGSQANVETLLATIPEPKQLVIVEGADHFFTGHLDAVGAAINDWLGPSPHPAISIDTHSGPVIKVGHTWHRLKAGLLVHPGAEHQNSKLGVRQQTPPTPGGEAFGLCLPFFFWAGSWLGTRWCCGLSRGLGANRSDRQPRRINNAPVGRFGLQVLVEEQGQIQSRNRERRQPAVIVRDSPERDTAEFSF